VVLLANWVMLPLHTQRRSPVESAAESDESDLADTELPHGQSASADTKVSVYKIIHESERGSEGVDWIHLT
jgi:hypothetical protein